MLLFWPNKYNISKIGPTKPEILLDQENPLEMFMYALDAPESKRQYPKRLKVFLDFLTSKNELSHSDLENQCIENSLLKSEYL